MPSVVINPDAVAWALEQAATRRVSAGISGDSNSWWGPGVNNGGYGYSRGLQQALAGRHGIYAIGQLPSGPLLVANELTGISPGIEMNQWSAGTYPYSGEQAPSALHQYAIPDQEGDATSTGQACPRNYSYIPAANFLNANGSNPQPSTLRGTKLVIDDLLLSDPDAGYRVHFTYGTFDVGGGSSNTWSANVRSEPTGTVLVHKDIDAVTGSFGLVDDYIDVPSGSYSGEDHYVRFGRKTGTESSGNQSWNGPFFSTCQQIEDTAKTNGWMIAHNGWFGGQTARHAAVYFTDHGGLQAAAGYSPSVAWQEYFRQAVRLQGGTNADKIFLQKLCFVHNDLNGVETANSIGPNPATSNTYAGITDNYEAIITALRGHWVAAGFLEKNFIPWINVYHDSNFTLGYRRAFFNHIGGHFAADKRVTISFNDMHDSDELLRLGLGDSGSTVHLSENGYDLMTAGMIQAILGGRDGSNRPTAGFQNLS